jgi:protoheme IX farnesyltransferase
VNRAVLLRYYRVTKPGIIRGNFIHIIAGYLLAYSSGLSLRTFIGAAVGISIVIASACVANNILDKSIDERMSRTKRREIVTGTINSKNAVLYSALLGILGFGVLLACTNITTVILGVISYVWYVWVYGYAKRTTWLSTVVGAVPGALPAMAGYTAVTGSIDVIAWCIFVIVFFWQLPHFYGIAIMRRFEYKTAGLPIITNKYSYAAVRAHIYVTLLLYIASILAASYIKAFSIIGIILMLVSSVVWIVFISTRVVADEAKWGKAIFLSSLVFPLLLLVASVITVVVGR